MELYEDMYWLHMTARGYRINEAGLVVIFCLVDLKVSGVIVESRSSRSYSYFMGLMVGEKMEDIKDLKILINFRIELELWHHISMGFLI